MSNANFIEFSLTLCYPRLETMLEEMNKRLEEMNKRLEETNKRLEETNKRLEEKTEHLFRSLKASHKHRDMQHGMILEDEVFERVMRGKRKSILES